MKINGNFVPSGRIIGVVFGLGMENKSKDIVVETKQVLIKDEKLLELMNKYMEKEYPTVDQAMGLKRGIEIGKQLKSKKFELFVLKEK